jgi:diaminopimelate epimerase
VGSISGVKAIISKYQATGNDMIVIDPGRCEIPMRPEAIRLICDRHFGVGADGICFGPMGERALPHRMRFFNPDGSEAEKSGNGLRVFARYLRDRGFATDDTFNIAMGEELIEVQVLDESAQRIALAMGKLTFGEVDQNMEFAGHRVEVTQVSMGNPHAVIFSEHLDQIRVLGPLIETAPQFPEGTNVQLVRVIAPNSIQIEIWERGAGYTLASGTSCSAAAGATVKSGRGRSPVEVRMAGGNAQVTIAENWKVSLAGTVSEVFEASLSHDLMQRLAQLY